MRNFHLNTIVSFCLALILMLIVCMHVTTCFSLEETFLRLCMLPVRVFVSLYHMVEENTLGLGMRPNVLRYVCLCPQVVLLFATAWSGMKSTYVVFSQSGVEDHSSMVVKGWEWSLGMVVCANESNVFVCFKYCCYDIVCIFYACYMSWRIRYIQHMYIEVTWETSDLKWCIWVMQHIYSNLRFHYS